MFSLSSSFSEVSFMRSDCVTNAIHATAPPLTLEASRPRFHAADLFKTCPSRKRRKELKFAFTTGWELVLAPAQESLMSKHDIILRWGRGGGGLD